MNQTTKAKLAKGTLFLYAMACVVLVIGIASLYNHVSYFNTMVAQYVEQGYPQADVLAQLLPSQFLPVIYQTVSLNLGIALVLVAAAMIYQKTTVLTLFIPKSVVLEEIAPESMASEEMPESIEDESVAQVVETPESEAIEETEKTQ